MEHTTLFIIVFYTGTYICISMILYLQHYYLHYQKELSIISGMPYY
jgi:hypothetical protein